MERFEFFVNRNDEITAELEVMFIDLEDNESIYYSDIIIYSSLLKDLRKSILGGTIILDDARDLQDYLLDKVTELKKNIKTEQDQLLEENLRFIRKHLIKIKRILAEGQLDLDKLFNELLLKIHTKFYRQFQKISSLEYNPLEQKRFEYENRKRFLYFELLEKIEFEKELIHQEVLRKKILNNERFKELIGYLLDGEIHQGLQFTETLVLFFLNNFKLKSTDNNLRELRKIFELNHRAFELKSNVMKGIVDLKTKIIKIESILRELFDFIEFSFMKGAGNIFVEESIIDRKRFEKKFISIIKKKVSDGKIEEALDLLLDETKNETEINNEVIILRSRLIKNKENERLGLETDEKILAKLAKSILYIIDSEL